MLTGSLQSPKNSLGAPTKASLIALTKDHLEHHQPHVCGLRGNCYYQVKHKRCSRSMKLSDAQRCPYLSPLPQRKHVLKTTSHISLACMLFLQEITWNNTHTNHAFHTLHSQHYQASLTPPPVDTNLQTTVSTGSMAPWTGHHHRNTHKHAYKHTNHGLHLLYRQHRTYIQTAGFAPTQAARYRPHTNDGHTNHAPQVPRPHSQRKMFPAEPGAEVAKQNMFKQGDEFAYRISL